MSVENSDISGNRKKVGSAIKKVLKKYGLELRTCGTKQPGLEEGKFDPSTGFWADTGIATKPPRWLVWIAIDGQKAQAVLPHGHNANRIGYFNLRGGNTGAILVRVIPVVKHPDGKFELREDWEWSLLFCFSPPLRAGTSGDAIDMNLENGKLYFQEAELPYVSAALIGLCSPDDTYKASNGKSMTYKEATVAIQELLKINPVENVATTGLTTAGEVTATHD